MKKKIKFLMDGLEFEALEGTTILQSAIENGIYIPNLCYNSQVKPYGACRLCLVENAEGRLITACENWVEEGMDIKTDTKELNQTRKMLVSLLIANHERNCLSCSQSDNCRLQEVAAYLKVDEKEMENFRLSLPDIPLDESNPFFIRDLKKCILCGVCVQTCADILGVNAIDFGYRGYETKIITFGDRDILDSNCVSCGECVVACPVGALVPKAVLEPSREIKTTCTYCGVGCGIYLGVRGNQITGVRGDPQGPANKGRLCVKGRYGFNFVNNPERLEKPLIKREGVFEEVEWEEALDVVAGKLLEYCQSEFDEKQYQKSQFAAISSAKCTNEENYIFQKFARVLMKSPHIDHCARLCHAPSVVGLSMSIGSGAMTNSIDEISQAGCIMAIGTNTTGSHPVIALEVVKAVKSGSKLIVINPQEIDLCNHADLFLQHHPGTDVALLMGMARVIWEENLFDKEFVEKRTENLEPFIQSMEKLNLDDIEQITGVNQQKIREAARIYATEGPSSILYAMGITQHTHGTENVLAISNLALLTGNLGKLNAGVNPLRGQNNVQGSCDMGALPNVLPGYQSVEDEQVIQKFQEYWNSDLSPVKGMILPEILENAAEGKIKAVYIMGENPLLSEPDIQNVKKALENLEFLVVQDIFLTETAQLADVVLPAASFAEKEGTFTNTERRVQLIRPAVSVTGQSKPDWWIISQMACKMEEKLSIERESAESDALNLPESQFNYQSAGEIFQEMAEITPIYHGISHARLEKEGIQWPCPDENHPGTPVLHQEKFNTPSGRGKFHPLEYRPPSEVANEEYPLILTTGRSLYQYHTGTMTRKIEGMDKLEKPATVEINPHDAEDRNIQENDLVEIQSRRGKIKVNAIISDHIQKGTLFMTFHFKEAPANCLTNPERDPISGIPELKISAVEVRKL
ncbi:MAG: formate dehydrogenase subunit alpha [Methanobacteriaceae archaeon]|jgi:formate dehydrogenase major subunit|nr:formate dehydrogenase subunit alpha [Methanobacteriaceae archaeon]MDP2836585.1 formate dehydrogenase subunit alpha [Methanobacteriaceae archaeon]MDP3034415.1 formate dehydrogenase subunit alpha [Methanobacteriaceae archaeon]MDP3485552.1 formate dehydrogenase subunit alpha [Methanobacteriaceae archaeon]MDP3624010.1 formate dehydrogenase subunit alpha [Methanobacteriaceae archaeon]